MRLIDWGNSTVTDAEGEPPIEWIINATQTKSPALLPEEREENELSFEYLIGTDPMELLEAEVELEGERQYYITDGGTNLIDKLRGQSVGRQKNLFVELETACNAVRREYGSWDLKQLLKYVYNTYPEMTTQSIIIGQVQGS